MPSGSNFAIFLMAELHKVERNAKGKTELQADAEAGRGPECGQLRLRGVS